MSRSGLSKLCLMGSIVLSLTCIDTASGQAQPPDLSGGEGGWVHARGARFAPPPGSASPVRQDVLRYMEQEGTATTGGSLRSPPMAL